jgi:tRNA (cmo5U34)-methyltransferase
MQRQDIVWKSAQVSRDFLEGMRGAIPLAAEQLDVMLRVIHAARPDLENFLDIGCGDGILGRAILAEYPSARGVLLDFSEPMIDAAREKMAHQAAQLTFLVEDYGSAAWLDAVRPYAPFDAVVSGFSIHHQPDSRKREIYQEIYDLLKPGGVFLNLEHVAPASAWVEDMFDELFIDVQFAYNQARGIRQTREEAAAEFHNRPHKEANILAPMELQCQWLREIGYQHVDCYLKIYELALFGGVRP